MRAINLFIFLLLTSLRLVAAPVGAVPHGIGAQDVKKEHFSPRSESTPSDLVFLETVEAEETEDESHVKASFLDTATRTLHVWLTINFPSRTSYLSAALRAASPLPERRFVRFRNFRI